MNVAHQPKDIETMSPSAFTGLWTTQRTSYCTRVTSFGSSSNSGSYKHCRSIARILTKIIKTQRGVSRYLGYAIHVVCQKFASAKRLPRSNKAVISVVRRRGKW